MLQVKEKNNMDFCPCGSKADYHHCCFPIIKGEVKAKTAEQLMRSRYSAYAKHEIDHLFKSYHPDRRKIFDRKAIQEFSITPKWLGLEIIETTDGQENDIWGQVEFIARFKIKNASQFMHEKSNFQKIDDDWFYVDGISMPIKQVVRSTKNIGRNDPCPCGSHKKFKKCCGNK